MKNFTNRVISCIIAMIMLFSFGFNAYASTNCVEQNVNLEELRINIDDVEINAKEIYENLSDEAKFEFDKILSQNQKLQEFHKKYVDPNFKSIKSPNRIRQSMTMAANAGTFAQELELLRLPAAVEYALTAFGATLSCPVGNVIDVAALAALAGTIVIYWDEVEPKWEQIVDLFSDFYSDKVDNIIEIFDTVKTKIIKLYYTDKKLIDDALERLDKDPHSQNHIKDPKHDWDKIVKDATSWECIRRVIRKTMLNGREETYKSVSKRVLHYGNETVTVTFKKINDMFWAISNAWVNK